MRRAFFLYLIFGLLVGCNDDDASFDVQGSYWQASCIKFESQYQACYGPGWSENTPRYKEKYDFYEISVEEFNEDGTTVLTSKRFAAVEVKKSVLDRHVKDIVEVDQKGKTLFFKINDDPYVVDLPNHIRPD